MSCGKHGTALQIGFIPRLRLCCDLEDSKSTSWGVLCIFWSRTFVPVSWMCKKQSSVSRSSTESEIISLDAGLRMDGLLPHGLVNIVIEVRSSTNNTVQPNHNGIEETRAKLNSKAKTKHDKRRQNVDQLTDVDYVPTNTHSSQGESQLYIFAGNEAVTKWLSKDEVQRWDVSRTHRVALDWLFDSSIWNPRPESNTWTHLEPTRRHSNQRKFFASGVV